MPYLVLDEQTFQEAVFQEHVPLPPPSLKSLVYIGQY